MSLQKIQERLKAPKNQFNEFGKYKYRNQEDILEAIKPLLAEYNYILNIYDTIEQIGDRYYVKATTSIYDNEGKLISSSVAYAREPSEKKGQDAAQVTGATSSYARKYALNGLLAIDDTKDADNQKPENGNQKPAKINDKQYSQIMALINETVADPVKFCKYMDVKNIKDITVANFNKAIKALENKKNGAK